MATPIILARRRPQTSTDITVSKYVHLPPNSVGPYVLYEHPQSLSYVPSSAYFYIRVLASMPEEVHKLGSFALSYSPPTSISDFDILRALIPTYDEPGFTLSRVDPRLWATLAQLYKASLPDCFSYYSLPLSDSYIPLLQSIPATVDFSMVTILELPGCSELDDTTIVELKSLHTLCALEASGTKLTNHGIRTLSKTLFWDDTSRRGPWPLRILRLRNCPGITGDVLSFTAGFPLLSVLDLRGTKCWTSCANGSPWSPSTNRDLYHPTPLRASLAFLRSMSPSGLFSSLSPYYLCIDGLRYAQSYEPPSSDVTHDVQTSQRSDVGVGRKGSVMLLPLRHVSSTSSNLLNHGGGAHRTLGKQTSPAVSIQSGRRLPVLDPLSPDWMQSVSSHEIEEARRRESVSAFYSSPLYSRQPSLSAAERNYQIQEATFRTSGNAKAMFYRDPPPWTALEQCKPTPTSWVGPTKKNIEKVSVDMNSEKARLMAAWQTSLIKEKGKRKENMSLPAPERLQDTLKGGNPFRRKSDSTSSRRPAIVASENEAVPPSLLGTSSTAVPSKRVRPISSLYVPNLPEEEKKKLADATRLERRQSLPDNATSSKTGRSSGKADKGPPAKKAKTFDMKSWLQPKPKY